MNTSSDEWLIPICCTVNVIYPPESLCYQNGTNAIGELLTDVHLNFSIPIVFDEFICNETTVHLEPYPPNNDEFTLMENGTIYVNKSVAIATDDWLRTDSYCLTSLLTEDGRKDAVSVCYIFRKVAIDLLAPGLLTILIALGISFPCFVATFLVYTILPELKNVHGFTLRAYVASQVVVVTLYGIILANPPVLCTYLIEIVVHFSLLASYFWLNVMCFDIWWTFRRFKSSQGSSIQGNRKKCTLYAIYAWGSSAVITGVGAIIDSLPTVPTGVIRPGLRTTCLNPNPAASAIYMTGPAAVTAICNACFFVLTAVKIIQHEKDMMHDLNGSDNQRHNDEKQRFYLYLKLFIVMGILDSAEIIFAQWPDFPEYIAEIANFPGAVNGISIFIIFVCKDKIKQLLLKRLGCKDNKPRPEIVEFGVGEFNTGNLH